MTQKEFSSLGGKSKSKTKKTSSALNGKNQKPHFIKVAHFEKIFPHKLINNEWKVKFTLYKNGKKTTYNPDYYCEGLGKYIEVTTSKPNISEQGWKWAESIRNGHNLLVFWWEGENITEEITKKY